MTLRASTRRLDRPVDLLVEAGARGHLHATRGAGLAGRGVALRIPLPVGAGRLTRTGELVAEALTAIEIEDEVGRPGTGPVAFAALPFAEDTPGWMTVPAVVVGVAPDGTSWRTTIGDADDPDTDGGPVTGADAEPTSYTVRPGRSPESWCEAVAQAVGHLRAGELDKVVLAREILVEADARIDVAAVLRRLAGSYPGATVFSIDGFVGATPELLVSRAGEVVRSHPHAGTVPRTGDPAVDAQRAAELLASAKDRAEHRVAIDMVLDTLLPFCSYVDSEPEPSIVSLANVQHLASMVEGRLSSPAADVLTLAAALHPTPAVCGSPTDLARKLIDELEGFDRGRYAGAVGWVDARGDGELSVAVRCAEIDGRHARLFAGGGIVADSDPATELAETRAKLQAMLGAIVRP